MMSSLSGYGEYIEEVKADDGSVTIQGKDDAAETFLYEGLSKVYKINNICNSDNLDKCGIPSSFTTMAGTTMNFPKKLSELNPKLINTKYGQISDKSTTDTKVAAFETVNGESVAVFYNPNCKNNQEAGGSVGNTESNPDDWHDWFYVQNKMCVNFIYDLNGLKGPNKVGHDIGFITALYTKNSEVVAPVPYDVYIDEATYNQQDSVTKCAEYANDLRLPNMHELSSLFYNMDLIGNLKTDVHWSGSVISSNHAWSQKFLTGSRSRDPRSMKNYVRCIKK